jgi:23S rRNA pseudouridine2605 synthase
LFAAVGHEVTRLKRVAFGRIALGDLSPGEWRALTRDEIRDAFPEFRRRGRT